jgi:hypothetical protein
MNKRKVLRALGLSVILWGAAVIAVNTKGVASCVPQVGLSALLQKALFAPTPSCPLLPDHITCDSVSNPGGVCTINTSLSPGHGTAGHCVQTFGGCACVPTVH